MFPLPPSLLLLLLGCCCRRRRHPPGLAAAAPPRFPLPPLLVTCSDPRGRVYRRLDSEVWASCLWDGPIELRYTRGPGAVARAQGAEAQLPAPLRCRWYRDAAWVQDTARRRGRTVPGPGLARGASAPPRASSRITVQCVPASCTAPTCARRNLSIEVSGQEVQLFLRWPPAPPIPEMHPVPRGWCARLKSARWRYRFSSRGGNFAARLIPSNQHRQQLPPAAYPQAELHQLCSSYYSFHLSMQCTCCSLYIASVSVEQGPRIGLGLTLRVEPALLHVLSAHSRLFSLPLQPLSLSWSLQPLGPRTLAYRLLDMQGMEGWSASYNPYALRSNFCADFMSQKTSEMALAGIYFHIDGEWFGELAGELSFSNATLGLTVNRETPTYLTLNARKNKMGTYIFSHNHGLYYTTQENNASAPDDGFSTHYVFFQQQSLSFLLTIEFVRLQWYRFNMHLYLNRKGALFRSLVDRDIEVHIFNSGPSFLRSLIYIVWFIPVQHPMLQCEWTFNLQLFGSRKEYLIQNNTYTYDDHVRNAAHFVRRSVLPFNPALYTGFVAKVNCTRSGLTPAVLKVTVNTYASKVTESLVSCQKKPCFIERLRIQKPDLLFPIIHTKKGTHLNLFAKLQVNCTDLVRTEHIWKIYGVQNVTTIPDWTKPLDPPLIWRRHMLILPIPSYSLDYGLYLFNFSVKITAAEDVVEGSDKVFVQVEKSDLVAVIAGGSFRTVGFSDNWTLDGSTCSDPDSLDPLEGLTYTWYCTKHVSDYVNMTLSTKGTCHPDQQDLKWIKSSGPIQTVLPETLQGNAIYNFRLVIQKDNRKSYADQTVSVKPGSPPLLNVMCIENCGKIVIPTDRFTLSGKCLNCRTTSRPVYQWSLFSESFTEVNFDWASKTSTGKSSAYLSIHALTFINIADRSYTLLLKITTWGGRSSAYRYSFYVNSPPRIGKCTVNPTSGVAFLTKFIVQCSGFSDNNLPLIYKVIAASDLSKSSRITSLEENTLGTIVYFGYQPKSPPSFLPIGVPSKKYSLTIYVQVYDSLGSFSQLTLYTTVQDPAKSRPPDIMLNELISLTSGSNAPMTSLLQIGDYLNVGYLVYMVATILNDIKAVSTIQESKAEFRESLLNQSLRIPTASVIEVNQIVACVSELTQEVTEVNRGAQQLAVSKLKDVSEALRGFRDKSLGSEQTELLSMGILTGLSNILEASLLDVKNVNVRAVKQTFSVMETLADTVLRGKVPGENETIMEAKSWNINLKKDEKWDVTNAFSSKKDCKNCFYPTLKEGDHSELAVDAVISTVFYEFEENPFPWLAYKSDIGTTVTGFKMTGTKMNGDIIGIMPAVAEVIVARKDKESAAFKLTIGPDKTLPKTTGGFSFEVDRNSKDVFIQILTKLKVSFNVFIYVGVNVTNVSPVASFSASHNEPAVASGNTTNNTDCAFKAPYVICLPQMLLRATAPDSETDKWNISIILQSHSIVRTPTNRLVSISLFNAACLDLDGVHSQWKEGRCILGPHTSWQRVHCICKVKHQTKRTANRTIPGSSKFNIKFLASKVFVIPNPVDLEESLLVKIHTNTVTLLTVLSIFLVYFILALWAMRKDRIDRVSRDKVIVLPDNDPFDKVCFLVTLYTGSRLGAGTTADVFLQLIGENGTSDVHHLQHPHYQSFIRGGIDTFLLTTKNDLGDIFSLRVWHNNRGSSPGWFLSRVKVENMYTKEFWLFICRKWLALDKDDHLLERTFVVTHPKVPLAKMDYFLINIANNLVDSHLWLSVFAQVVTGSFNRLQRLSCCLAVLLCTLLVNIMFFNIDKNTEVLSVHLRYLRSIIIGIESALVTIPVQMIITALFRYSQKEPSPQAAAQNHPKESSPFMSGNLRNWKERLQKWYLAETSTQSVSSHSLENYSNASDSYSSQYFGKKVKQKTPKMWSNCTISEGAANAIATEENAANSTGEAKAQQTQLLNSNFSNNYTEEKDANIQEERKPLNIPFMLFRKRPQITFYWWCVYVSWILVIAVAGVSSFFIILYGLAYGYKTSIEWLFASISSFFESVLFLQSLKIILFSALSTVYPKYSENIPWSTRDNYLEIRLDDVTMNADEMREMHYEIIRLRGTKQYRPLEEDELTILRKREKIKTKAFIFLKDIVSHFVFLTLVLNIAYSTENTNSFYYNQVIHKQFSLKLSSVNKLEHIYMWVNNVFLPLIHNNQQPTFLPDSWSKILGLPRMRQVRAKITEKKCFHPHSFVNKFVISKSHCLHKYGSDPQEKGDYVGSWTKGANRSVTNDISNYVGFTYQSNRNKWVYYSYGDLHTYGPGGYTVYFFPGEQRPNSTKRLDVLQNSSWLDEETWAVIIELTTFNPDVHLFCSISVMFEVSYFGTINTSLSVHSFTLPIFQQQSRTQMFVFVTVLAFLLIYIIDEIHVIHQERTKYVKNVSNLINFVLKSVLFFFVFLQVIKFKMGADIVKFYLLNPNDFTPFHAVSHVDQTLKITMGFLAFLIVLKTLRYSRFFYDVRLAQRSILAALPGICSMALVVAVYFFVYMAFGYLVFGQHEWTYNNMIHSAQTVFSYCVSAFKDTAFTSNRLLGGIFLASFMLVMICVLINLFQAVIMSAYEDMKQPVYEEPSDEAEVITFLVHKIRRIWYFITCRPPSANDPDLLNSVLYGQAARYSHRHLGLKTKKINGKKMAYLVI
ncbi:polycystin family receptor for egg jelly [Carettochelys insculpta]|uniref:polycystin family receptor for egg jelly n=1 Tax=Carettochelys insculpta TaxID=44489 RepID=UPI003EB8F597